MKLHVTEKLRLDLIKKWVDDPKSVSEQELKDNADAALMRFVSADWSTRDGYEKSKLIYETFKAVCKVSTVISQHKELFE